MAVHRRDLFIFVALVILSAQKCLGQMFILSLDRNDDGRHIVLTCAATTNWDMWRFWVDTPNNVLTPSFYSEMDRTMRSITIEVTLLSSIEGYYYCGLSNQPSNSEGPFTGMKQMFYLFSTCLKWRRYRIVQQQFLFKTQFMLLFF